MKNKQFLTSRPIAHRGIHTTYIENTLVAFQEAIKKNNIIEFDVQLSKDHEVIIFHDQTLKRIFGINREMKDLNLSEIKKFSLIPTFQETLNTIDGKVPIIIDLKFEKEIGLLEKKITKLLDTYQGEFAIQSFNPLTVLWFRLNRPNYIRGYLVHSIIPDNFLLNLFLNTKFVKKILKPDFIGVNLKSLKTKKVQKLRKKYIIVGYTIQNKKEYQQYQNDADNFITEITID